MRTRFPRITITRLLLAIAILTPLSVAIAGYTTGCRCPACFSGRVVPVYYNEIGCGWDESVRRGEIIIEYGPGYDPPHRWACRDCDLKW